MEPKTFSYESMGTKWKIFIWDDIDNSFFHELQTSILKQSKEFDETYSRFIKTSLVWELTQKIGRVEVPQDFMNMFAWYKKLYIPSEKKFNPLIGFTISDLGYDADYTLLPKDYIRLTPDLSMTVQIMDDSHIYITEPVLFDFGGIGKGYFVDKIASFLQEKNIQRFLVDGSGDVSYRGNGESVRMGLEHPDDPSKVIGVVEMKQGAMCASGSNRRKWDKYYHIVDPTKFSSPPDIIAVWVIAGTATLADALATCLFLTEPENFSFLTFEYCILNKDYKIKRSAGFEAELF